MAYQVSGSPVVGYAFIYCMLARAVDSHVSLNCMVD